MIFPQWTDLGDLGVTANVFKSMQHIFIIYKSFLFVYVFSELISAPTVCLVPMEFRSIGFPITDATNGCDPPCELNLDLLEDQSVKGLNC